VQLAAESAGALALAASKRVAGKCKCALVSRINLDTCVLAVLLAEDRPRVQRKPRQHTQENHFKQAASYACKQAHRANCGPAQSTVLGTSRRKLTREATP